MSTLKSDQDYILNEVSPHVTIEDPNQLASISPVDMSTPNFLKSTNEVASMFFSSGTTGRPKGICHSLESMVGNVDLFNRTYGIDQDTRMYHVLPMCYMAGFLNTLLSPWVAGGVALVGPRFRPLHALHFWKQPLSWGTNAIWLTPTLASVLTEMSRDKEQAKQVGGCFRHVFCGTAPLSQKTRENFISLFGAPLQESYGMSEVLLVSAQTRDQSLQMDGVGDLLPSIRASFRPSPNAFEDELVINTPFVLQGYFRDGGIHDPELDTRGGFPTGDTGKMEGHYLRITGRLKDLIIRGGLNVSSLAIEEVLRKDDKVKDLAVVGLPDEFWGEIIVVCIVPKSGFNTLEIQESLQRKCSTELAQGMRPDRYVWVEDLPRATTGKIQKHRLREILMGSHSQ